MPELYSDDNGGTRVFYIVAADNLGNSDWIPYVYKWNGDNSNGWPGVQLLESDIDNAVEIIKTFPDGISLDHKVPLTPQLWWGNLGSRQRAQTNEGG